MAADIIFRDVEHGTTTTSTTTKLMVGIGSINHDPPSTIGGHDNHLTATRVQGSPNHNKIVRDAEVQTALLPNQT